MIGHAGSFSHFLFFCFCVRLYLYITHLPGIKNIYKRTAKRLAWFAFWPEVNAASRVVVSRRYHAETVPSSAMTAGMCLLSVVVFFGSKCSFVVAAQFRF